MKLPKQRVKTTKSKRSEIYGRPTQVIFISTPNPLATQVYDAAAAFSDREVL